MFLKQINPKYLFSLRMLLIHNAWMIKYIPLFFKTLTKILKLENNLSFFFLLHIKTELKEMGQLMLISIFTPDLHHTNFSIYL